MLSVAKHLLYLIKKQTKQILRFAHDDMVPGVFPQPARLEVQIGPKIGGEILH